ncbi:hypothetical protein F2Q70_00018597 [Brassica cretica]|uniref:Uncharacterized protein n=1 Tax=Brassica cretica TaxID=69181 RepID=A0A8S9I5D6_BRACR|nr:hypothetical protein F2Q70_00018597 [Brassica cretica]
MRSRDRTNRLKESSRGLPFKDEATQPRGERRAIDDENPTLPLGEDGIGLDPEDLVELSDSSAEEDGGYKSNEQVPASNPQGTEEDLEESSAKEQGNVDGVENPPDSTTDGIGGASDPLAAQVIGGDLDLSLVIVFGLRSFSNGVHLSCETRSLGLGTFKGFSMSRRILFWTLDFNDFDLAKWSVERKSDRPGTAAILQTPTSSQGDHAIERSNEQTGRDLEGLSVQERGDVSGVERTEDTSEPTTAPDVSNQAPVALDLMVREEPSIPTLGVSDEDPTLPLVKLSDSSAEEDGNKSDEQVPASNPQGKEGNLGESSARV